MKDINQKNNRAAKPFVKWAGGKGSLVKQFAEYLPKDFNTQENVTYIEPFVGGGAMLFYMLTHYSNIKKAIINDINEDLISCYKMIKENPSKLIYLLKCIEKDFHKCSSIDTKTDFYYSMRECYNNNEIKSGSDRTAYFIFLNKTCFNGLYRVNTKGKFNVPFGKKIEPNICDEDLILVDHELLQKVDIYCGDYSELIKFVSNGYCFMYMDPPYRPLLESTSFVEYTYKVFDDIEQENLKLHCDILTAMKCKIMQSNSNSIDDDGVSYFSKLYGGYNIKQIEAHRFINAHVEKRKKETELLITNY